MLLLGLALLLPAISSLSAAYCRTLEPEDLPTLKTRLHTWDAKNIYALAVDSVRETVMTRFAGDRYVKYLFCNANASSYGVIVGTDYSNDSLQLFSDDWCSTVLLCPGWSLAGATWTRSDSEILIVGESLSNGKAFGLYRLNLETGSTTRICGLVEPRDIAPSGVDVVQVGGSVYLSYGRETPVFQVDVLTGSSRALSINGQVFAFREELLGVVTREGLSFLNIRTGEKEEKVEGNVVGVPSFDPCQKRLAFLLLEHLQNGRFGKRGRVLHFLDLSAGETVMIGGFVRTGFERRPQYYDP